MLFVKVLSDFDLVHISSCSVLANGNLLLICNIYLEMHKCNKCALIGRN